MQHVASIHVKAKGFLSAAVDMLGPGGGMFESSRL